MTKAYIQGFCKTAESYGVDPNQLIKVAIPLASLLATARATNKVSPQLAKALSNVGVANPRLFRLFDGLKASDRGGWTTVFPKGNHITKKYYSGIDRANRALKAYHKASYGGSWPLNGTGTPETEFWASILGSGKAPPLKMNYGGEWLLTANKHGRRIPQQTIRNMFGYNPAIQPTIDVNGFKVPFVDRLMDWGYRPYLDGLS